MDPAREFKILEQDRDVINFIAKGPQGAIEVIAQILIEGDDLILREVHVEGPGPLKMGMSELRILAQEFGRLHGVRRIIIHGGVRGTGANPGHRPRPLIYEVD